MKNKIFITGKIPQVGYELLTNEFDVTIYDGPKPMSKEEIMSGLVTKMPYCLSY